MSVLPAGRTRWRGKFRLQRHRRPLPAPISPHSIKKLELQTHIANLPGEEEATNKLASAWAQFREAYAAVMDPDTSYSRRHQIDLQQLRPLSNDVRIDAQQIIDMNLGAWNFRRGAPMTWAQATNDAPAAAGRYRAVGRDRFAGDFHEAWPLRLLEWSGAADRERQSRTGRADSITDEIGQLSKAFNDMARSSGSSSGSTMRNWSARSRRRSWLSTVCPMPWLIEPRGQIELVNETAKRLFQLTPGSSVMDQPSPWLSDLHQEAADVKRAATADGAGGGGAGGRSRQAARWFCPGHFPSATRNHHVIGLAVMLADVTELRRLDEIKNHLLATAAHELKTPLTSIRMAMHLIAEQRVGDRTTFSVGSLPPPEMISIGCTKSSKRCCGSNSLRR